jgi:hypothetical protein
MLIDWLARDEVFFGLLGVAALAFIWNGTRRISWETTWEQRWQKSRPIPESMVFYGATELRTFAGAARDVRIQGRSGLAFYANKILRGCDLAYAAALAILTAYVWFRIALAYAPTAQQSWWSSIMVWLAPYSGAMAIAYGVADIAEDLKLASILLPRGANVDEELEIDRAEAAAANMLTVIKMLTLLLSVIGFILFLLLRCVQSTTKFLTGTAAVAIDAFLERLFRLLRRGQDAPAGTPSPAD